MTAGNLQENFGADYLDWYQFSEGLGLTSDLLPVVSNPHASISPQSSMKTLGKTPSVYNSNGLVAGLPNWTSHKATQKHIDRWSAQPDYGICIIARTVKAIDIDIEDTEEAYTVSNFIEYYFDLLGITLPVRYRNNSNKILMAFRCAQETEKRVIRTEKGLIEFLGNNQQFVAAGTHSSGKPYQWHNLGDSIPELSLEDFDRLWNLLQKEFGKEPELREKPKVKAELVYDEPVYNRLAERGLIKSTNRNGSVNIICPFEHEHTTESAESSTVYWPAHTGGFAQPAIKCLHAHCAHRSTEQFKEGLGFSPLDDFEDLSGEPIPEAVTSSNPGKFQLVPAMEFANSGGEQSWLVKGLIPSNSIGSMYGPSGAGKSFMTLDLVASIARGVPWRGRKTKQGACVYICAEGSYGFRNRIKAYAQQNGIENPEDLPIYVIDARPNLMTKEDVLSLLQAIEASGVDVSCVVVDTYAACMVGDENSSVDSNKVINGCKYLQQKLKATILLVHHSGKDVGRGARGWSGLRAAVDFELQVLKEGSRRGMVVTKQKDGEEGLQFGFDLDTVVLGEDEDGEPITSCTVTHTEVVPLSDGLSKSNPRDTLLYDTLIELNELTGEPCSTETLIEHVKRKSSYRAADLRKAIDRLVEREKFILKSDGTLELNGMIT